jgi:hypothetical protein
MHLKKSNKKTAAFYCQRFGNLHAGFSQAVKAWTYGLSGVVPKLVNLSKVIHSSPIDSAILPAYRQPVNPFLVFSTGFLLADNHTPPSPASSLSPPFRRPNSPRFRTISLTILSPGLRRRVLDLHSWLAATGSPFQTIWQAPHNTG